MSASEALDVGQAVSSWQRAISVGFAEGDASHEPRRRGATNALPMACLSALAAIHRIACAATAPIVYAIDAARPNVGSTVASNELIQDVVCADDEDVRAARTAVAVCSPAPADSHGGTLDVETRRGRARIGQDQAVRVPHGTHVFAPEVTCDATSSPLDPSNMQ